MAQHSEPNYFGIIVVLAILTAAEVGVVLLGLPRFLVGVILVVLALWKAGLVALYFMHLKFEKKTLALIAVTPLILCALLMFSLLPDSNPEKNLQVAPDAGTTAPPATH
jgi:cytochrome c oxidase subunit 4